MSLAAHIDRLNETIGRLFSWLALGMVLMTFINVVQRYVFHSGYPWEQEAVYFMFAIGFLGTAGYTLKHDGHVRVDVFYSHASENRKAWIDLLGTLFLLFPVCVAIIYVSWDFVLESWRLHEGSSEYRGMPGVFLLKTFIWVFAGSLFLQGIATILRSTATLSSSGKKTVP